MNENFYAGMIENVREKKPLIHQITNYVTVNDCANVTLAIGASPIMADDIEEAADITLISSALVLNIGTLNSKTVESMLAAGKAANQKGIPVIFEYGNGCFHIGILDVISKLNTDILCRRAKYYEV